MTNTNETRKYTGSLPEVQGWTVQSSHRCMCPRCLGRPFELGRAPRWSATLAGPNGQYENIDHARGESIGLNEWAY